MTSSLSDGFRPDELAPPGEATVRYRERLGVKLVLAIGWSFL